MAHTTFLTKNIVTPSGEDDKDVSVTDVAHRIKNFADLGRWAELHWSPTMVILFQRATNTIAVIQEYPDAINPS